MSETPAFAPPTTPEQLFRRLDALGLQTTTHRHAPVFTVEESRALRGQLPGGHCKNLFLRDRKKNMWLLVAEEDRPIDLKRLRDPLGARGGLSFGSAETLMEVLGVIPGAVTPFAVVNDPEARVTVVIDRALLDTAPLNCHPLANDMTTAIDPADLLAFLEAAGHSPVILDLDASAPA